ncbi:MAG: Rrf2 family transcriptional regulator [Desulfobacteraceae bacterium]|nr:Rrf2 family transcriptional regulator [Desulfobacteraceae bacterium]
MLITQKKQYALRAVFELAKHQGKGPVKSARIAEIQAIPTRFLEVILSQLKRSGIVAAKRGYYGGYQLIPAPEELTVGGIFRFLDQSKSPEECLSCETKKDCPFEGNCAFMPMWHEVQDAMNRIYDRTTIRQLIETEGQVQMGEQFADGS